MNRTPAPEARGRMKRRGIALLLVMVGLVVCTLLTAGFLSTQGTSIAIARNERDAEQCRMLAQAGIDLCFAQIRALDSARVTSDQPGWREKMLPGTWLSSYPVGNGTVTVTVHSSGSPDSFTNDLHQPVVMNSTGYLNNSSSQFTLTATIGPTGGGEVFRGGNFFGNTVTIGSSGSLLPPQSLVDSYNSTNGPYSASGAKAILWTNSNSSNSITINAGSTLDGSVIAGTTAPLSSVVNLLGSILGGTNTALSLEARDPGVVLPPTITGLTSLGGLNPSSGALANGLYDSIGVQYRSGSYVVLNPGFYAVKGNFSIANGAKVVVNGNTTLYVAGNVSLASSSSISVASGTLTLYVGGGGGITVNSATISASGTNPLPAQIQILGLPTTGGIQITGGSRIYGVIYSPKSDVTMSSGSPQIFGAIVANSMKLQNLAQFHYDESTKSVKISSISAGTAPPGAADYTIRYTNSPN